MNKFFNTYKNFCKVELGRYGFKSFKNNNYRAINDVFQSFNLHKSVSGNDCTVEFLIAPLCRETTLEKTTCSADHLKMFEGDFSWFAYEMHSEKSINQAVSQIIEYMNKYLIPFFERGNDCKNAYNEIRKFEMIAHKNKTEIYSSALFGMALKTGDYALAAEHLREIETQWLGAYETNETHFPHLLQENKYTEKKQKELSELRRKIMLISEVDMEFINCYIETNERKNLRSLGLLKEK